MFNMWIGLLCGCCLVVQAFAAPRSADTLILCYEDQNSYPWVMTDGSGLNLQLLQLVDATLPLDRLFCLSLPFLMGRHPFAQGITSSHEMGGIVGRRLALILNTAKPAVDLADTAA